MRQSDHESFVFALPCPHLSLPLSCLPRFEERLPTFHMATVSKLSNTVIKSAASSSKAADISKSLVFLHGILGKKTNFRTACNRIVAKYPNYQAVAVDHRGHGDNIYKPPETRAANTVASCAKDLMGLLNYNDDTTFSDHTNPPTVLAGHSFGGKVALLYLKECLEAGLPIPEHTFILDCLPGTMDSTKVANNASVTSIIDLLVSLPATFDSKEGIINRLVAEGIDKSIVMWIATNIVTVAPGSHAFSFDIHVIEQLFRDFCRTDCWEFLESYDGDGKIHFVRAGKNQLWETTPGVLSSFAALTACNANITLHTMPHVGHWLHSEDLEGTLKVIADYGEMR